MAPHPSGPARTPAPAAPAALLLGAIFLVALNLRAALTSLTPLVHTIQRDLGLSATVAGLLTSLPVLCMGLFAPVAQRLGRRVGRERTVAAALVLLLAATLLRLAGSFVPALVLSSVLAGTGIALVGTLLPGIVKRAYPGRVGLPTATYLLAMLVGAAAASALAVPVARATGSWQVSLAVWSGFAVVGLLAWVPVVRRTPRDQPDDPGPGPGRVRLPWRSPTARLLAGFMGLQSLGFYGQLAWIAPSYEARGLSDADAGLLLGVWVAVQVGSSVGGPALADRVADRRVLVGASVACSLLGLVGITWLPGAAPVLWVAMMGLGQGGGFAIGLVKLADYAPTPDASARLTAMVFLVSYSLASLGPLLLGAVRDLTGGFTAAFGLLVGVAAAQLLLVPLLRPGRSSESGPRPAPAVP
jgi:CP family cyanate transporter-like MFS transporter